MSPKRPRRLLAPEFPTDNSTSQRMSRVARRDTGPELAVRRAVHSLGLRYRVRNPDLPGSPDLANRKERWAILVHGCFLARPRLREAPRASAKEPSGLDGEVRAERRPR